jgi:hypothetical protein
LGLLEAQEELHVSKDCTRQFSLSTPFNKSVTGLGTISGLILAAGGVHVGVSNVGLCPTVSLRSQLIKSSTPILLPLSAVVERLPVSDLV